MPPRDPKLCPALERALPADDIPGSTRKLEWPERVLILCGDGEWHPVRIRSRGTDTSSREVLGMEWSAGDGTWTEFYVADGERIREP